ncbi:unnamed protein product, partial [Rotaria sordida]
FTDVCHLCAFNTTLFSKPIDKPKFRPDQSKFEYEKNQFLFEDINTSQSSIWNSSWDGYDS